MGIHLQFIYYAIFPDTEDDETLWNSPWSEWTSKKWNFIHELSENMWKLPWISPRSPGTKPGHVPSLSHKSHAVPCACLGCVQRPHLRCRCQRCKWYAPNKKVLFKWMILGHPHFRKPTISHDSRSHSAETSSLKTNGTNNQCLL